jgi:osmotically-inducible protein OsmY
MLFAGAFSRRLAVLASQSMLPPNIPFVNLPMLNEQDVLQRVDSALRAHPHLRSTAIRTSRVGDRVVLNGDVTSFFEKQMAQEAVRYVDGVPQIDNQLVVKAT